jgi:hypothetical protein
MADRDRIRSLAISRRTEKLKREVNWGVVVAAFQNASAAERQAFATAIYGDPKKVWNLVDSVMVPHLTSLATVEVDAAMVDDMFTLDELEDLFLS